MYRQVLLVALAALASAKYQSEYVARGADEPSHICAGECSVASFGDDAVPDNWDWANVDGVSYLTKSLNQHLPQYCGSCWAHGAVSALADRIKIDRQGQGIDLIPSVQHILNCGNAGSCHGGNQLSVYQWIMSNGGVAYDTANPYIACSSENQEGFCPSVDTTCTPLNVARTCPTFGEPCVALDHYPNVTVTETKEISGEQAIMTELYNNGPLACGVDAEPILDYEGGIFDQKGPAQTNHIVSITGYGVADDGTKYWNVRNSWGEFWGEMGFFRIVRGNNVLNIESGCAYAVLGDYTSMENGQNFPCHEGGDNCIASEGRKHPRLRTN